MLSLTPFALSAAARQPPQQKRNIDFGRVRSTKHNLFIFLSFSGLFCSLGVEYALHCSAYLVVVVVHMVVCSLLIDTVSEAKRTMLDDLQHMIET